MTDKGERVEIPPDVAAEVLFLADRTCCVCRQRSRPVQLHHIDDDPANSVPDNLAVLCFDCHRETQIHGGFDRKLDAAQIRLYKLDWITRVEAQRNGAIGSVPPEAVSEKQLLRYLQVREKSDEFLYDIEADYVQVGAAGATEHTETNLRINAFVTSTIQRFREAAQGTAIVKQKMREEGKTRAFFDSLAISHKVSLYTPDMLSVEFQLVSYGVGAAHPNSNTKTMNFRLRPSKELHLRDVFKGSTDYLGMLSRYCADDIRKQQSHRQSDAGMGPDPFKSDYDAWLLKGTEAIHSNFECFSFSKSGITIHFDPYRVACYADGKYEVFVPSYALKPVIHEEIAAILSWN